MNYNFMDSIDPTLWLFLIGLAAGTILEAVAVCLTMFIIKRSSRTVPKQEPVRPSRPTPKPKQESRMSQVGLAPARESELRTGSVSINRKPVIPEQVRPVAQSVVRPQPVIREQPVVVKEQPVREPPVVRERPVVREQPTAFGHSAEREAREVSVARAQAVIQEQLAKPDNYEPVIVEPSQRVLSRYIYYVDDREETYQTLLGILQALFPEEAVKYSQVKRPLWTGLPKSIRDSIQREETVK